MLLGAAGAARPAAVGADHIDAEHDKTLEGVHHVEDGDQVPEPQT